MTPTRAPGNTPSIPALFPRSFGIDRIGRDQFKIHCLCQYVY
jgi:hypothetical protein